MISKIFGIEFSKELAIAWAGFLVNIRPSVSNFVIGLFGLLMDTAFALLQSEHAFTFRTFFVTIGLTLLSYFDSKGRILGTLLYGAASKAISNLFLNIAVEQPLPITEISEVKESSDVRPEKTNAQ